MTNPPTPATAVKVAPSSDVVKVFPRNGLAPYPSCSLERIAIIVSDSDGDEDCAQVVVRPNDLAALLHAKNLLWGPGWHYQESWQVAHPDMDGEPKWMAVDGPVWEF